jgi:2-keto-4-pentenoate hydratase/2-oxohepta-3-ene-1,7-dioic acid hydratase in catechol pathway
MIGSILAAYGIAAAPGGEGIKRFVRYRAKDGDAAGILEGENIRRISGDLFGRYRVTGSPVKLKDVKLLAPVQPPKIFAVGLNYRSHLGNRPAPKQPEIFYKPITALQDPGGPIVIPKESVNTHYEGELVLVIGRTLRNASEQEAAAGIFGVSCGNDVSERDWQNGPEKDLQWWRAKGHDTFAPLGPVVVTGIDYNKLKLQTRLNGEVVQEQSTADLLFPPAAIVSFISRYVTLQPGDLVYTGTPGTTRKMKPGDTVEVEIEGIGTLKNPVVAA